MPSKLRLLANELDANSSINTTLYQGVDVSLNLRWRSATLLGGTSTGGRTRSVTCDVEDPNNLRFCDQTQFSVPFQTQFKLAGTYALPYGIRLGANFQSQPGTERIINYAVVRSILPTLTQTSVNVRLNEPGSEYNDRVNQFDVTVSKSFRNRGLDIRPDVALFNVLNTNPGAGADQHIRAFSRQRDNDFESTCAPTRCQREVLAAPLFLNLVPATTMRQTMTLPVMAGWLALMVAALRWRSGSSAVRSRRIRNVVPSKGSPEQYATVE